ncbi:DUF6461 domain-containing protein [Streptomyces sp. SBT349]|uniref:DUF6461 domain-containing protein n=1 Tax=Streptomyces sp. SBT349 TaxID=1580539 RepID=UPI000AEB9F2D|nr:DUF6461 domain-containing protein [Streptomyces sp. SBT349]
MTHDRNTDAVDYRQLLRELWIDEAACVTAVTSGDEDAVIRCFGGDPDGACEYSPLDEDFFDRHLDEDRQLIALARTGPAVVVMEIDGFEGAREEVLRPLTRLGRAASAYWGEDAMTQLSLAEDGRVLSQFEMLFPENRQGARPEAWTPFLHGLTFGTDGDYRDAGLRAIVRATGAHLDLDLVGRAFRIVEIKPVGAAVIPQGLEDSPLLTEQPYAHYLADLGPHLLPEMRHHAFGLALQHTELAEDALALAAVGAFLHASNSETDRSRLRKDVATAKAMAMAQRERPLNPARAASVLANRRTELWTLLDYLLSNPTHVPAAVLHLQKVMTGEGDLVDRYWLLNALHEAAERQRLAGS